MQKIVNIVISLILMALGVYVMFFIPTAVDFSQVLIRLEDNDKIYQFLIYIPLIISIFNGILVLVNTFLKNITLSIMNALIAIATSIFIFANVMGSVNAVSSIGEKLKLVSYGNIVVSILLIATVVYYFVKKKNTLVNKKA